MLLPLGVANHSDIVGACFVDSQGELFVFVVIQRIEVPQEQLSKDEVAIIELVQLVLSDRELALALGLVQILASTQLKHGITSLICS